MTPKVQATAKHKWNQTMICHWWQPDSITWGGGFPVAEICAPSPPPLFHLSTLTVWMFKRKKSPQQGRSFYVFKVYNQWKATLKALQFLWALGPTVAKPVSWTFKGRWRRSIKQIGEEKWKFKTERCRRAANTVDEKEGIEMDQNSSSRCCCK